MRASVCHRYRLSFSNMFLDPARLKKGKKKTFSKDSSLLTRYLHLVALPSLSDRTLRMNRLTWLFQSKCSGTTFHRQESYADIDTLINEIKQR